MANQDETQLIELIAAHTHRRRHALRTIKQLRASPAPEDQAQVTKARAYLDTWRVEQAQDFSKIAASIRSAESTPTIHQSDAPPRTPTQADRSFTAHVTKWRDANAARLKAMPLAELRIKYLAARVLRTAPDLFARMDTLPDEDLCKIIIATRTALDVLADDMRGYDNDQLLADLLDLPRLESPQISQTVIDDIEANQATPISPTPPLIPAPEPILSNLQWIQQTSDTIERKLKEYLTPRRWGVIASHFGAILTDLNEQMLPRILNDPHALKITFTPETAVAQSLLKASLVPDHTDTPEDAVAWFEALQLWLEDQNAKEIPAKEIKALAADFGVDLLPLASQPMPENL